MATYLRFTTNAKEEVRKGFSYFKTPSMSEAIELEGLCGFSFDTTIFDCEKGEERDMTRDELARKIQQYADNYSYYNDGEAVIIEGEYLGQNQNGEGVIFRPERILSYHEC